MLRAGLFSVLYFFVATVCGLAQGTTAGKQIVGDAACLGCHEQGASYVHTGHYRTSRVTKREELRRLVQAGGSELKVAGEPLPKLAFAFTAKEDRLFETAVTGWGKEEVRVSEPMDIAIGSGKRGQTFLYWAGNQLFELPVSFWEDGHRWINSPGYIDGTADYKRPVQPGCLECHATAAVALSADAGTNSYQRASLVYGISCETCHGAGGAHVAAEKAASAQGGKAAEAGILNPAKFSRERQLDLCALCHSGIQRSALQPAFTYVPGQALGDFYKPLPGAEQGRPDVHGNQVGLLERSRCFRESDGMTCSTCHNVHTVEQPAASYSPRCLTCHTWQSCGEAHRLGAAIQKNCINCHMPVQATEAIVSTTAGERIQASMRTHWIRVYGAGKGEQAGNKSPNTGARPL